MRMIRQSDAVDLNLAPKGMIKPHAGRDSGRTQQRMLSVLPPHVALRRYVAGYWFVEDIAGTYEGRAIWTAPFNGAVFTVNIGRPNAMVGGPVVPRISLLGPQSERRQWLSWAETCFAMAILTPAGLARLFPHHGTSTRDRLVELSALLGEGATGGLMVDATAAPDFGSLAECLDRWLLARLEQVPPLAVLNRIDFARRALASGASVEQAAATLEVSRRQLHRWFVDHLGRGPREFAALERLQASLRAHQWRSGDPLAGYSDQSHRIRDWRRRLGLTPGQYTSCAISPMAETFQTSAVEAPAFYL